MNGMGGLNYKNIKQYLDLDTQFLTNSVVTQLTLNPIDFYNVQVPPWKLEVINERAEEQVLDSCVEFPWTPQLLWYELSLTSLMHCCTPASEERHAAFSDATARLTSVLISGCTKLCSMSCTFLVILFDPVFQFTSQPTLQVLHLPLYMVNHEIYFMCNTNCCCFRETISDRSLSRRGSEGSILSSFSRSLQRLGHNPCSCWSFCSVDGVIGAVPWESCRNFCSGGGESSSVGLAAGCLALGVDGSVELGFFCDITLSNRELFNNKIVYWQASITCKATLQCQEICEYWRLSHSLLFTICCLFHLTLNVIGAIGCIIADSKCMVRPPACHPTQVKIKLSMSNLLYNIW